MLKPARRLTTRAKDEIVRLYREERLDSLEVSRAMGVASTQRSGSAGAIAACGLPAEVIAFHSMEHLPAMKEISSSASSTVKKLAKSQLKERT